MRELFRAGALALVLSAAGGIAAAQQPAEPSRSQGDQKVESGRTQQLAPAGKDDEGLSRIPTDHPGNIDGEKGNTAGHTPEDGQAIGAAPSDPHSADGGNNPAAVTETTPAKHSPVNAEKDAHWWLDRGQELTAEQKQEIYAQLAGNGAQKGAGKRIFAEPSAVIPYDANLFDIPRGLAADIPYIGGFKYVVEQNKVVLVDPVNGTVAAVIEGQ